MTDREIFKNNLTELMESTKAKQIDIANSIGVSYQTVSAWVCGRGYPRADAMKKLCDFFGVRQSFLVESHEKKENDEEHLVSLFRALSTEGKKKMLERAEEMHKLYPMRKKNNG